MLSPQALVRGLVQRALPALNPDGATNDVAMRMWSYGEQTTQPIIRKAHVLSDEGCYYTGHNNQSGVASNTNATYSSTAPFYLVYNGNPAGGKNVYLDYALLLPTAAGGWASAGVNIQLAIDLDTGNRYSSGGTLLTLQNANMNISQSSGVIAYAGAITATAASGVKRTLRGLSVIRPAASATAAFVVGDFVQLNSGGVEAMVSGNITVANANIISQSIPPIVIPPQSSALIHTILNGTTPSAFSAAPEIGFWVR